MRGIHNVRSLRRRGQIRDGSIVRGAAGRLQATEPAGTALQMLGIRHASVSQTRRSLEEARLVQSSVDPGDARSRRLSLTDRGRQLVDQLEPVWDLLNATSVELDVEAGHVIAALDRLDAALSRRSLYDRVNQRRMQTLGSAAPATRTPAKGRKR